MSCWWADSYRMQLEHNEGAITTDRIWMCSRGSVYQLTDRRDTLNRSTSWTPFILIAAIHQKTLVDETRQKPQICRMFNLRLWPPSFVSFSVVKTRGNDVTWRTRTTPTHSWVCVDYWPTLPVNLTRRLNGVHIFGAVVHRRFASSSTLRWRSNSYFHRRTGHTLLVTPRQSRRRRRFPGDCSPLTTALRRRSSLQLWHHVNLVIFS